MSSAAEYDNDVSEMKLETIRFRLTSINPHIYNKMLLSLDFFRKLGQNLHHWAKNIIKVVGLWQICLCLGGILYVAAPCSALRYYYGECLLTLYWSH